MIGWARFSGLTKFIVLAWLAIFCHAVASAHPYTVAYWRINFRDDAAESRVTLAPRDLSPYLRFDADSDGIIEPREVSRKHREIVELMRKHFRVLINEGVDVALEVSDCLLLPNGDLEVHLKHLFREPATHFEIETTFYELSDVRHTVMCRVDLPGGTKHCVLDATQPRQGFEAGLSWRESFRVMGRFLLLGVEHIFTGYDHLVFLVGLIILGDSLKQLVKIVSSFTVAHSITLVLATLDAVSLSPRFVESAIALTICYIALENIFVPEAASRWKVTFFLGLIHGFGFSSILRAMDLPKGSLAISLLSFNAGVEIGQVAILLVLFPLVLFLAGKTWRPRVVTAVSVAVGGMGLVWFLGRVF